MKVGEFCNREVVVADRDTTVLEAAKLMRWHHVGDIIVTDQRGEEKVPVGILTDRDIVVELLAEEIDLSAVSVGDAMSFELLTASEEEDLFETVQRMRNRGVRRVPVVNVRGTLVGILTLDDVLEALSERMADVAHLVNNEQHVEHERRV